MITVEEAVSIARRFLQCRYPNHYPDCVEDAPKVDHLRADLRPDGRLDSDAWEVWFPWKPVDGMIRTSRGCGVIVDMASGRVLE